MTDDRAMPTGHAQAAVDAQEPSLDGAKLVAMCVILVMLGAKAMFSTLSIVVPLMLFPFFVVGAPAIAWLMGNGTFYWNKHSMGFEYIDPVRSPWLAGVMRFTNLAGAVFFAYCVFAIKLRLQ